MPTVPRYDNLQEQPRALPGVQQSSVASPALFGATAQQQVEFGRGLMAAGDALSRISRDMQDREDADVLFRTETSIKTEYLEFEKAMRERRGAEAKDITKEAAEWWTKAEDEHSRNLTSERQRQLFQQQMAKLRLNSIDNLASYEAGERRRALEESAQASIVSSVNLAASQVGTPTEKAAIIGAKDDILKRLAVQKQLNGWAPEMYEAKQAEALTNLHLQIIQRKADIDPQGAKEYYRLNKGEINGTRHDDVEKLLKQGTLRVTAQTFADGVMAAGVPEGDAIRAAREKYSGEEEAAVVAEIKTRFQEMDVARQREQRSAADEAWNIYARTGRFASIPASILSRMDGRDVVALSKEAESGEQGGKTDWDKYYELYQKAFDDPEAFAQMDLRREFPHLDRTARRELMGLQAKAKDEKELKDVATLDKQIAAARATAGISPRDKERQGLFDRAVRDEIDAEERARKKRLTYSERQQVIDRLLIEGKIAGSGIFRDDRGRVFELKDRADFNNFVPNIPANDRRLIVERFRQRNGRTPTEAEVAEVYKFWKGL